MIRMVFFTLIVFVMFYYGIRYFAEHVFYAKIKRKRIFWYAVVCALLTVGVISGIVY